jgi:predicted Kef-type K+ transport protein
MLQHSGTEIAITSSKLILYLILYIFISNILRIPFLILLEHVQLKASREVFLLSSLGVLLIYIRIGILFDQSTEISCFVAGVMIASKPKLGDAVMHSVESLKQFFGALFFASIGLHIYPSFLIEEGFLLLGLTLIVILFKVLLTTIVIYCAFRKPLRESFIIGVGLAQISEFTFVLSSKAKGYYVLITLALASSPENYFFF